MPVVVEPDQRIIPQLLAALPPGGHAVESTDRLQTWLTHREDEYVVLLGPGVPFDHAITTCESLRFSRPTTSVVLIRDYVDYDVLTKAMQAGARDVVPLDDGAAINGAIERAYQLWIALRGPSGATHKGKIISVFSPKGGVGKTTLAVNMAMALCDKGAQKVCVVDLDLAFGDVAITLQLFPTHTIEHAVGGEEALDYSLVDQLLTRHTDALMVLAAPSMPDVRDRVSSTLVTRLLRTLQEQFDYVVVDTAPSFDEQTLTALDETDECIIMATLDVPTLKNVKVAMDTLDMLNIAQGHRHLLLNRADEKVGIDRAKVESILGMPVVVQIPSSIDIAAATNAGRPIIVSAPNHPASQAFRQLAARMKDGPDAPVPALIPAAPVEEEPKPAPRLPGGRRKKTWRDR